MRRQKSVSLEDLFDRMQEGAIRELNLIIKADVQGSVEAAQSGARRRSSTTRSRSASSTPASARISESDIMLAAASKAIVVGFNVRPNAEARQLAEREGVDIRTYRVIYQLTEDIEKALVGMLAPEEVEEVTGEAEVRALFKASRLGTIAGCMVTHGRHPALARRSACCATARSCGRARSTRSSTSRTTCARSGRASSAASCSQGFNDVKEGDVLEAYASRQVERTEL